MRSLENADVCTVQNILLRRKIGSALNFLCKQIHSASLSYIQIDHIVHHNFSSLGMPNSAENKGHSMVDYRQSLAFDHPYLLCNDHCDQ